MLWTSRDGSFLPLSSLDDMTAGQFYFNALPRLKAA
jgi:hypothetical protein